MRTMRREFSRWKRRVKALKDVRLVFDHPTEDDGTPCEACYDSETLCIVVQEEHKNKPATTELLLILLHEMRHAIQWIDDIFLFDLCRKYIWKHKKWFIGKIEKDADDWCAMMFETHYAAEYKSWRRVFNEHVRAQRDWLGKYY